MVRSDLQHLIIDIGRSYCGETYRFRDDDMDLERAPMRNVHGKYSGDRLAPLFRYLRKQVGRPWRVVHSELCRAFDKRSLRGYHLHSHITNVLVLDNVIKTDKGYRHLDPWRGEQLFRPEQLFVDEHGLIRRPRPHKSGCFSSRRHSTLR